MGVNYNPKTVIENLELCLDPANVKSYPGTGTTLFDLSGSSRNGAIQGSPTYTNPYFTLDGNTQRIRTTYSGPNNLFADGSGSWSTCSWFRCPVTRVNSTGTANASNMIMGRGGGIGTAATFAVFVQTPNQATYGTPNTLAIVLRGAITQISLYTINDNEWHHVSITWNGTTCKTYLDGEFRVNATVGTATLQNNLISIGDNGGTSVSIAHAWEGDLSQALVYSKALNDDEVEQNFNALRGRYGI